MKKCFVCLFAIAFLFAAVACFAGDNTAKTATQGDTVKVDMSGSGCPMMKTQQTGDVKAAPATSGCPAMKTMKAGDPNAPAASCPMMKGKAEAGAAATAAGAASDAKAMGKNEGINLEDKGKTATANEVSVQGSTVVGTSQVSASGKITEGACPDVTGKTQIENFHNVLHPMHEALREKNYDDMRKLVPELVKAGDGLKTASCPMGDKCPPDCKKNFETRKADLLKSIEILNETSKGADNTKFEEAYNNVHESYIKFASSCDMPKETKATATEVKSESEKK